MADDDSAEATGLELTLTFSGSLLGQSVVLTLGTITFAETSCTVRCTRRRPADRSHSPADRADWSGRHAAADALRQDKQTNSVSSCEARSPGTNPGLPRC